MARLNVNPTRMERLKQRGKERVARHGHKLLKDKYDEMVRHFLGLIKQNRMVRENVENDLVEVMQLFMTARLNMSARETELAVLSSTCTNENELVINTSNIMGLVVPDIKLKYENEFKCDDNILISTNSNFDKSIRLLSALLAKLVELANIEKACDMLASEIEKNRRRINALEYRIIPQTRETIKYITMKLSENERGNQVRFMKVKDIIAQQTEN